MLCTTMFCVAENASVTGNFAHKKEAYANRQIQGFTLPQKERIGQVETSSDNGAQPTGAHCLIQLFALVRP